jgi:hypothetical protein
MVATSGCDGYGDSSKPPGGIRHEAALPSGAALDCGHLLPEERADETHEALAAFFTD